MLPMLGCFRSSIRSVERHQVISIPFARTDEKHLVRNRGWRAPMEALRDHRLRTKL